MSNKSKSIKHKKTTRNLRKTTKNKTEKVFRSKDYKSGDGMLTNIWGPSLWHVLHTISFNYPNRPSVMDKKRYKSFIKSLVHVLPCKYCRMNLKNNFKELPLTDKVMENRHSFSKYIFRLHEHINHMLGKTSNLTFEEVRERYEHFRSRCSSADIKKRIFTRKHTKKEKGCVDSLYGIKSKCILKIVPQNSKYKTFSVNKKCNKKRLTLKKY